MAVQAAEREESRLPILSDEPAVWHVAALWNCSRVGLRDGELLGLADRTGWISRLCWHRYPVMQGSAAKLP